MVVTKGLTDHWFCKDTAVYTIYRNATDYNSLQEQSQKSHSELLPSSMKTCLLDAARRRTKYINQGFAVEISLTFDN